MFLFCLRAIEKKIKTMYLKKKLSDKVFFPGEISRRLLAKICFYQGTCLLFPRDCEGSEPDSRQMFSWEENGQQFWNISIMVLIVETPVWMGVCM